MDTEKNFGDELSFGNADEEENLPLEDSESSDATESTEKEELETPEELQEKKAAADEAEEKRQLTTRKFIAKLQRDRLRAEHEAKGLREKVAQLEETTGYMNDGVLKQQALNATLMLEKAKLSKKQALELGDTDAIIDADQEISSAAAQLEYLKMIPAPRQQRSSPQPPSYPAEDQYESEEEAMDPSIEHWLGKNSWFDQRTPDYNPDKAADIAAYATGLDAMLTRQGRQHEFYTPQYFAKIDNYARLHDQQSSAPKTLHMRTGMAPVSSVRNGASRTPIQRDRDIQLTSEEKELVRLFGVSEENWKKHKKEDLQKTKTRQREARNDYR